MGRVYNGRLSYATATSPICSTSVPEQLKSAREDIKELLKTSFCHPILVIPHFHFACFPISSDKIYKI